MNFLVAVGQRSAHKDQRRCLRVIIYQTLRLIYCVRERESHRKSRGCGLQSVIHTDSDYVLNIFFSDVSPRGVRQPV
jgi:hypothetical protein